MGGTELFRKETRRKKVSHGTVSTRNIGFFVFVAFVARKAQRGFRDVFVVRNGFGFCLVWCFYVTFVAHEARLGRAKRDGGVCGGVDWFWILSAFVECKVRRGVL